MRPKIDPGPCPQSSRRRTCRTVSLVLVLALGLAAGASVDLANVASAAQRDGAAPVALPTAVSAPRRATVSVGSVTVATPPVPLVNVSTTVTTPSLPSVPVPSTAVTAPSTTVTTPSLPQATVPATRTVPSVTAPSQRSAPRPTAARRRQATGPAALTSRSRPAHDFGSATPRGQRTAASPLARSSHRPGRAATKRKTDLPYVATPSPASTRSATHETPSLPNLIGRYIPLPLPVPDWSKPIILMLALLCLGFGFRTRVTSRRARRLERSQQALVEDIGAMQPALVPEIPPSLGALAISVAYRPADGPAAGGDFYDAFKLVNGRVVIILGDVSGHGRPALAHAARMRYTLRAYAEAGLAPREVLKLAERSIGRSADGLYTTVAIAVHDATAGSLTYASAGHPPPLFSGCSDHEPLSSCASPPLAGGFRPDAARPHCHSRAARARASSATVWSRHGPRTGSWAENGWTRCSPRSGLALRPECCSIGYGTLPLTWVTTWPPASLRLRVGTVAPSTRRG